MSLTYEATKPSPLSHVRLAAPVSNMLPNLVGLITTTMS